MVLSKGSSGRGGFALSFVFFPFCVFLFFHPCSAFSLLFSFSPFILFSCHFLLFCHGGFILGCTCIIFFYCFLLSPNTFVFVYFQMFNAIKQGVVHSLQQPPPDIEALRVYLLLPEFSIYQKEEQYDAIVIPFGEAILRLSVDAGKVLSEYE